MPARSPFRGIGAARALPWARPRHERLLLALVAAVALSQLIPVSAQDVSRICLGQAILHGRVSNDACFLQSVDQARYGAHIYSDKAPGLSLLEIPSVALFNPGPPQQWSGDDLRLWAVRILSVGLCLLLCAFLVGRVSEGLAPGYGAIALVTFALGTLVGPLAGASFEHVPAAAAAFGAFLLAWRRRPLPAGLVAGASVLLEYECGVVVVVLGLYVALQGRRSLLRYLAGLVPAGLVLGAYDWAAFGAPWHLSYSYLSNFYAGEQSQGLFGIGVPHLEGVVEVFAGQDGLLVFSPVLVVAALGLVRLARDHLAEAAVAAVVAAVFIVANCGYFEPYGGQSPGPRFLAVALPFLALGLAAAYSSYSAAHPRPLRLLGLPDLASIVTWGGGAQMSGTLRSSWPTSPDGSARRCSCAA